jgi:hypothetical protein
LLLPPSRILRFQESKISEADSFLTCGLDIIIIFPGDYLNKMISAVDFHLLSLKIRGCNEPAATATDFFSMRQAKTTT